MTESPFSEHIMDQGQALFQAKKVGQTLFSEGTYQIEVGEFKKRTKYWPFLQMDDAGVLLDCLCNCTEAEKTRRCAHMAAAYQQIFNGHPLPLHVRFRASLWNQLCRMAMRRHGESSSVLKKKKAGYEACSVTRKPLFFVQGQTAMGKKTLETLLFQRPLETEETSLKFSNLSPDEISLWKSGHPSDQLQYELSFWSDLAKWFMALQEAQEPYQITFEGVGLPQWIHIHFSSVSVSFYVAQANWPTLIPSLSTVNSKLQVFDFQGYGIKSIRYDLQGKSFHIEHLETLSHRVHLPARATKVGQWYFLPDTGFFPQQIDPLFKKNQVPTSLMGSVLRMHPHLLQKFLINATIHPSPVTAQYRIYFDRDYHLHITCFLFEPEDLFSPDAALFEEWVYLPSRHCFYRIDNQLFGGMEKVILASEMNDFINSHRAWLNGFEGFQTHVYTIESHLHFKLSDSGSLHFETALEMSDIGEGIIDFGEWVYLQGKGFFAKRLSKGAQHIAPGTEVLKADVSSFIHAHQEGLELLHGFFAVRSPLDKIGLELFLNPDHQIVVRPHFQYVPPYTASQVQLFGNYTYVDKEGFFEIPYEKRVPEPYLTERVIPSSEEAYFVFYELDSLQPFLLSVQNELKRPKELGLHILELSKPPHLEPVQWHLVASFVSELGAVPLFDVWRAFVENKKYLFSQAGLLFLKTPRFHWMKNIVKRQWIEKENRLRLSTLEWLRVTMFEECSPPTGKTVEEEQTRMLIQELQHFHMQGALELGGLKSDLRPYQEIGVRWLWFLYLHGLSGLLCDEMGLGKTHQAMGLIACVHAQGRRGKVLIVCPTSVLYHWEERLRHVLPDLRTTVFYGLGRTLNSQEGQEAQILLTSYGTLRSETELISQQEFEVAIFDELQNAKNPHSQIHKALKKVKAVMRLGLTGTPVENRLLELKALFDVILPGYLLQDAQFKEFFVNPIEKGQDVEKKALLSKLIKPFLLRRKKAEVLLELPEKIEEIAYCDLSEEQRRLYRDTFLKHKASLLKSLETPSQPLPFLHIFSLLSALKQICDHPCLMTKQLHAYAQHMSGKWELFIELLQEIRDSGQKVVVFSQYLDMLTMIQMYLDANHIGYAQIRGSTRDRKGELQRFKEDPHCEVFLASLQAAGVGIDLVAASVVIHYDRWWNPAKENQATDRVHRIGQSRGVQVFKLVTKETIEEHIHQLIEKKMTLMEGIIGFDEKDHIKGLDREEILKLLWLIDKDVESRE